MDTYLAVASKRDWRSYADRPVPDDVKQRILDAGRVTGSGVNRQPWTFVVVESDQAKERVAETVFAQANVRTCAFAVAIATEGGKWALDVGRALQNMMLVAWNDGVASCPNGMPDEAAAAAALELDEGWLPVNIPSFGYPKRPLDPESKSPEQWSAAANRKPLDELVRRV
ncbi:MAG TPA: nitroreductase family protein [Gaiellaceae bacterium]|nr:nitroreductase family protein [Gaiellaceae bacterium]